MTFLKNIGQQFLTLVFSVLLLTYLIRLFEICFISYSGQLTVWGDDFVMGAIADFQFYGLLLCIIFPFYLLFSKLHQSLTKWFVIFGFVILFIFQILLVLYFNESVTPLTFGNLNGMSKTQVMFILEVYEFGTMQVLYLILLASLLILFLVKSLIWFDKKILKLPAIVVLLIALIGFIFTPVVPTKFKSEQRYDMAQNKIYYFVLSYFEFQKNEQNTQNLDYKTELDSYYDLNNLNNKSNFEYPFYLESVVRNPLGPFFPENKNPPNVVFIISESLGKLFSGKNARLGSFTPFLDSLAEQSLYWENMIANAERTFGAIPNFMSGVPEGTEGFLNLKSSMPDHLSLPMLLKENNGYQTNFYCGAWKKFDNMSDYLEFQKFDNIHGKSSFSENNVKKEIEKGNGETKMFNWGAEDRTVFEESLKLLADSNPLNKPYFNLYLTTSFHKPYGYTNESKFIKLAKEKINKLKVDNKSDYLKQVETFAALLYADDCLRSFFEMYKKRADFENTIFIISGDHAVRFMSEDSRLEKYHVPLLVYSPQLLRAKYFKSVVCQKDVPSSLQGLLLNNYNLKLPKQPISMSDNLDTLSSFSTSGNNFAIMYADKTINNYVFEDYFYADGMLFKIQEDMSVVKVIDDVVLKKMKKRVENYRLLSHYTCENNYVMPSEVYNLFTTKKFVLNRFSDFEFWTDELKSIYTDVQWTTLQKFSGKSALTNHKEKYLTILKSINFDSSERIRLKINFKMFSESEIYPSLYILQKSVDKQTLKEKLVSKNMATIGGNNCVIKQIKNSEWIDFEGYLWVEPNTNSDEFQNLSAYLFFDNDVNYYIDDLKIQIENFN